MRRAVDVTEPTRDEIDAEARGVAIVIGRATDVEGHGPRGYVGFAAHSAGSTDPDRSTVELDEERAK